MSGERQYLNRPPTAGGGAADDLNLALDRWAAAAPWVITADQRRRFVGYMQQIFAALGMPVGPRATTDTARRFLRAIFDASSGYERD